MSIHFQCHPKTRVMCLDPSLISLETQQIRIKYANPSKSLYECVSKIMHQGATSDELVTLWKGDSESEPISHLFFALEELHQYHFLAYVITGAAGPIAKLLPCAGFKWGNPRPHLKTALQLSRFAYLRQEEGIWVLESPLAFAKLEIFDPFGLQILMRLAQPILIEDIDSSTSTQALITLLEQGHFLEEPDAALGIWEFHDLLFHSRSRLGRHANPSGGTFRFLGKIPPFPVVRPSDRQTLIPLKKGDLEHLQKNDIPFSRVLEERRSERAYGENAITLQQLGEFLFRSAAFRSTAQNDHYEIALRTTPSGGGCHPIEIYPLVARCKGLAPGLYYYHPLEHGLMLQTPFSDALSELLKIPEAMLKNGTKVQVLLIFAARFGRAFWKYQSIGYSLLLKDVGALMQTMYLVATAMNLAPCANGVGNSELFSQISGLNYFVEGAVGEFLIGSKKLSKLFIHQSP